MTAPASGGGRPIGPAGAIGLAGCAGYAAFLALGAVGIAYVSLVVGLVTLSVRSGVPVHVQLFTGGSCSDTQVTNMIQRHPVRHSRGITCSGHKMNFGAI